LSLFNFFEFERNGATLQQDVKIKSETQKWIVGIFNIYLLKTGIINSTIIFTDFSINSLIFSQNYSKNLFRILILIKFLYPIDFLLLLAVKQQL